MSSPETPVRQPPALDFAFEIEIELTKRYRYGPTFWGAERGFVGVESGVVRGPRLNGIVIPHSGGDWPTIRSDHTVKFEARYLIQADDGTIIELQNRGVRYGNKDVLAKLQNYEAVDPAAYYGRCCDRAAIHQRHESPAARRHDEQRPGRARGQ